MEACGQAEKSLVLDKILVRQEIREMGNPEIVPADTKYFIVGLSHGKAPARTDTFLPISILQYLNAVGPDGKIVLFDAPGMGWQGGNEEDWQPGISRMNLRIKAILAAMHRPEVEVLKASDVTNKNPERFAQLVEGIKEIAQRDSEIAHILWLIVPPHAKRGVGLENKKNFEDLEPHEREAALNLAEYEVYHLAFIIFCKGQKILQGRSEERSAQIVKILCAKYSNELGIKYVNMPLKLKTNQKGTRPYNLMEISTHLEYAEENLAEAPQIPLKASMQIAASVRHILEQEGEPSLRQYLAQNAHLPGLSEIVNTADFKTPEGISLAVSNLVHECMWPIEVDELKQMRESDPNAFFIEAMVKINGIVNTFAMSPRLRVIMDELMPILYSPVPLAHLRKPTLDTIAAQTGFSKKALKKMGDEEPCEFFDLVADTLTSIPDSAKTAPKPRFIAEAMDAISGSPESVRIKYISLLKFVQWLIDGMVGAISSLPLPYEREVMEKSLKRLIDMYTVLRENTPKNHPWQNMDTEDVSTECELEGLNFDSHWWQSVMGIDQILNDGRFTALLDGEKGSAGSREQKTEEVEKLSAVAIGLLLKDPLQSDGDYMTDILHELRLKDWDACVFLYRQIMLPYLAEHGDRISKRTVGLNDVGGRNYTAHKMYDDRTARAFCEMRQAELGLTEAQKRELNEKGRERLGLPPLTQTQIDFIQQSEK
ncbi:MAG: hypothetical protein WCT53_01950, partial [Candidatus Gracilibacteria bacterium]